MATKTNINLIVNGTKVYTRKTTGRPYTHALVFCSSSGEWSISSCSSKGPGALQRQIDDSNEIIARYSEEIAKGPEACAKLWKCSIECASDGLARRQWHLDRVAGTKKAIFPIIDNTVTVTA